MKLINEILKVNASEMVTKSALEPMAIQEAHLDPRRWVRYPNRIKEELALFLAHLLPGGSLLVAPDVELPIGFWADGIMSPTDAAQLGLNIKNALHELKLWGRYQVAEI